MSIDSQNFDSATAPALPSGWTWGASLVTSASPAGGITPISSPNVLALPAPGNNTHEFGVSAITDGNTGDVSASWWFNAASTTANQTFGVVARASATSISETAGTYYWAQLSPYALVARIYSVVAGVQTVLPGVLALSGLPVPDWYQLTFALNGTSLTFSVQRQSDGYWLNATGSFQSAPALAIAVTDSTISGAGYWGLTLQSRSDDAYADSGVLDGNSTTSLYGGDGAAAPDTLLPVRYGASAALATSGVPLRLPLTADPGRAVEATVGLTASLDAGAAGSVASSTTVVAVGVNAADAASASSAAWTVAIGADNPGVIDLAGTPPGSPLFAPDVASTCSTWLAAPLATDAGFAADFGAQAPTPWGLDALAALETLVLAPLDADATAALVETALATAVIATEIAADDATFTGEVAWLQPLDADAGSALELFELSPAVWALDAGVVLDADGAGAGGAILAVDAALATPGVAETLIYSPGYLIYSNRGDADPINYDWPVGVISGFSTTTWTSAALASPGTWSFGLRAVNQYGPELNLDCAVTFTLSPSGTDISDIPAPPSGLRAFARPAGAIRVEWTYPRVAGPAEPTGFHVYIGTPPPSLTTPAATVPYGAAVAGSWVANLAGYTDGTTYQVVVRAYNTIGESASSATATVTAQATGPTAVTGLSAATSA